MTVAQKPLSVGKKDRYQLGGANLLAWLNGEALISFSVEPNTDFATLTGLPAEDDTGVIGFFLTGVAAGKCEVHINYATATRSDCATVYVIVQDC